MLSQKPSAVRMRRLRARLRDATPRKPWGMKPDYAKHRRIVSEFEAAKAKGDHALNRLVIREGYSHRASLADAYRRALRALASSGEGV